MHKNITVSGLRKYAPWKGIPGFAELDYHTDIKKYRSYFFCSPSITVEIPANVLFWTAWYNDIRNFRVKRDTCSDKIALVFIVDTVLNPYHPFHLSADNYFLNRISATRRNDIVTILIRVTRPDNWHSLHLGYSEDVDVQVFRVWELKENSNVNGRSPRLSFVFRITKPFS